MPRRYTDEEKVAALKVLAETGDAREASKRLGIPETTLKGWRSKAWVLPPDVAAGVAASKPAGLIDRLTLLIDQAEASITAEKLGATSAVQIATTLGILLDKRRMLLIDTMPSRESLAEIIKRHVRDPDTLKAIAKDLDAAFNPGVGVSH